MRKLWNHVWDQLLNDEEAAKNRLSAAKTWLLATIVQVLPMLAPGVHYHWTQWVAVVVTGGVAAGAKAALPAPTAQP